MPYRSISIFAVGAAMLTCASAQALAQAQSPAGGATAAPPPLARTEVAKNLDAEFKQMDSNGDGKLIKTEVQAAIQKRAAEMQATLAQRQKDEFDKLDANRDGSLSLAEYRAGTVVSAKAGAADSRIAQLDTNKDGAISLAEFRAATLAQFDKLDKDRNGVLSPQERAAVR
jgi:Ca2+-binding EF-hand superfamily protein